MYTYYFILILTIHNFICAFDFPLYSVRAVAKKPITVLVYMAADNSLNELSYEDLKELKKIGSNEYINILVHLNTRLPGQKKTTQKLVILPNRITQDGLTENHDSGDTKTLIDACGWAHTRFPSDSFVLVLWDHGSGALNRFLNISRPCFWWHQLFHKNLDTIERACCYDDTTGNYFTDAKLQIAFKTVCTKYRNGKKIDIIAFDACLMSCIEVAYVLQPFAKYMVSSQQTIPGTGFGYDRVLKKASLGNIDINQLAHEFIAQYQAEYEHQTQDYTLALLDLEQLPSLVNNTTNIAKLMATLLRGKDKLAVKNIINKAAKESTRFEDVYIDVGNFYEKLIDPINALTVQYAHIKARLVHELFAAVNQLKKCVINKVQGTIFTNATGLSIYFDLKTIDNTYPSLVWSSQTAWMQFLNQYLKVK